MLTGKGGKKQSGRAPLGWQAKKHAWQGKGLKKDCMSAGGLETVVTLAPTTHSKGHHRKTRAKGGLP